MHALAGIDHRPLGPDQHRRGLLHMHGVGAVAGTQYRCVIQRLRYLFVPHVGRNFDQHGAAAAVLQLGEGAAEDVADFGGDVDGLGRFHEGLHRLAGIEVRLDIGDPPRISHRQHQHGNGFAVTLRLHSSNPPMEGGAYIERMDWWDKLDQQPVPHVIAIEDTDRRVGTGALVGETHAAILQAMGCVGVITNGAVRDLPAVERLRFQFFSGNVSASHGYAHIVSIEEPVEVAGLRIHPGDLLHGDQHGIVKIPPGIASELIEIALQMEEREQEIIQFCHSKDFSRERLRELLQRPR